MVSGVKDLRIKVLICKGGREVRGSALGIKTGIKGSGSQLLHQIGLDG